MAYWFRHGRFHTIQSFMAISLFTVWVLTMIGVCQALSVLISVVMFRFFMGNLPFTFSIFSPWLQLHLFQFDQFLVNSRLVLSGHCRSVTILSFN